MNNPSNSCEAFLVRANYEATSNAAVEEVLGELKILSNHQLSICIN